MIYERPKYIGLLCYIKGLNIGLLCIETLLYIYKLQTMESENSGEENTFLTNNQSILSSGILNNTERRKSNHEWVKN